MPLTREVKNGIEQEHFDEVAEPMGSEVVLNTTLEDDVDLSGLELEKIVSYSFEEGALHFLVQFKSRQTCSVPYILFREDFLLEMVEYIMNEVDEDSRYGKYSKWARQMLREERRRIRNKAKRR